MMDAESFSLPPANGSFVMPTHAARPQYLRTSVGGTGVRISEYSSPGNNPQPSLSFCYVPFTHVNEFTGVQTPAAGRGSSRAGYHQQTQNAVHTYVPGPDTGPVPFLHTDVAGPEYPRDWRYPQPSVGLDHGGFTGVAQMDEVRPGSVTGVQTPAVGLGPAVPGPDIGPAPFLHTDVAGPKYPRIPRDWRYPQPSGGLYNGGFTSGFGAGYNQISPIATLGFAGQTLQAPFLPEYDTRAAAPPPTLDPQLFPPYLATDANNAFAEDFLPPAVSDNFMHMLEPRF